MFYLKIIECDGYCFGNKINYYLIDQSSFPVKLIYKKIFLFRLKFSNVDSRCLGNSKSSSNSNILDFGEAKQTINTPTVITMLVKRAGTKTRILLDLMHE